MKHTNLKLQAPNYKQYPMIKVRNFKQENLLDLNLEIGVLNLFVIWDL